MVSLFECIQDYDYYDDSNEEYTQSNSQIQTNSPMQTHCSGCGAPVNPHHEKCEYCGTYYINCDNKGYVNYLKGKCLEARIKNENAILSSQLKEELDKNKRPEGSTKILQRFYEENKRRKNEKNR